MLLKRDVEISIGCKTWLNWLRKKAMGWDNLFVNFQSFYY